MMQFQTRTIRLCAAGWFAIAGAVFSPSAVFSATIPVADGVVDEAIGDGFCSLIEAINEANFAGGSQGDCVTGSAGSGEAGADTITLAADSTYLLTVPYLNAFNDPTGLPIITSVLTIEGNNAAIVRDADPGTPPFRFFQMNAASRLTLRNLLVVRGNPGSGELGGAILATNSDALVIEGCEISANTADEGGAISFYSVAGTGTLSITDSQFADNAATNGAGGAIALIAVHATLQSSAFLHNTATAGGGAIDANSGGSFRATAATFNNNAAGFGGALSLASVSSLHLEGVTFRANTAATGGGLEVFSTSGTIANATLTENVATNMGGGILIRGTTQLALQNSTLAGNSADVGGGIATQDKAPATLQNVILAGNVGQSAGPDCSLTVSSLGHNLLGTLAGCSLSPTDSDQVGVAAGLGTYQEDAAIAGSGHLPLSGGSAAVDSGDTALCTLLPDGTNLAVDQLQQTRYGACDIGAVEFGACGDGFVQAGVEQCDDGNAVDDDLCSNVCVQAVCGDLVTQPDNGETCDDGNTVNDDSCSDACGVAICGDGIVQAINSETCDDGNTDAADGCDAACVVEPIPAPAPDDSDDGDTGDDTAGTGNDVGSGESAGGSSGDGGVDDSASGSGSATDAAPDTGGSEVPAASADDNSTVTPTADSDTAATGNDTTPASTEGAGASSGGCSLLTR